MATRIKGMTDVGSHSAKNLWPIGADVYKGAPKRKTKNKKGEDIEVAGENLPYFRVVFRKGYEMYEPAFRVMYGNKPDKFTNVRLAGTTDEVFPTGMAQFGGNHVLLRSCDQETIDLEWGPNGYDHTPKPCLRNTEKGCQCDWRGRLWFYLPDLMARTGVPFQFEMGTGDHRELRDITTHLDWVVNMVGSLSVIPFTLYRDAIEQTRPVKNKAGEIVPARVMNYPVILLCDMTRLPLDKLPSGGPGIPDILPPASVPDNNYLSDGDEASQEQQESAFGHPSTTDLRWWNYFADMVRIRLDIEPDDVMNWYECETQAEFTARFRTLDEARQAVANEIARTALPVKVFEVTVKALRNNPTNHCYVVDTGFGFATVFERQPFIDGGVIKMGEWSKLGTYRTPEPFWVWVENKVTESEEGPKQYWQIIEVTMNPDMANDAGLRPG